MAVKVASDALKALRKEVRRQADIANKRLKRLENNGLTDTQAYQSWLKSTGGKRFSTRGKSYQELQRELSKALKFNNSTTSTIKGSNQVLKDIASNTGIEYKNIKELQAKSKQFFQLYNKAKDYLKQTEQSLYAIGYKRVWEAINSYVKKAGIELGVADNDLQAMSDEITKMLDYEKIEEGEEGYSDDDDDDYEWL